MQFVQLIETLTTLITPNNIEAIATFVENLITLAEKIEASLEHDPKPSVKG